MCLFSCCRRDKAAATDLMSLKKNISFSLISKMSSLLFQLSSLSILAKTLSEKELSLYFLLLNLPFFFSLIDFGQTGGGFQNRLTTLEEQGLHPEKKELFLSHFKLSLSIYSFFYLLFFILILMLKEKGALFFSSFYISLYLLFTLMRSPFSLYNALSSSIQKGFLKNRFDLLEHFFCFTFLVLTSFYPLDFHTKITLLFLIPFLITLIGFFKLTKMHSISIFEPLSVSNIKKHLEIKLGLSFWMQNLLSLALFNTSIYIVAAKQGLEKTSDFFLYMRLTHIILGLHFAFLAPFSTFLIHLFFKKKKELIQKLLQALTFTIVFFFAAFCFLYVLHPFIEKWIHVKANVPPNLFVWAAIYGLINVFSIFLNAFNKIKSQLIFLFLGLFIFFSLSLFLPIAPFQKTVVIYSIISILPLLFSNVYECYTLVRRQNKEKDFNY